jgi:hypothetical protein
VEVGEEVGDLWRREVVGEGGHGVSSAEDDGADGVVIGGGAAGEIGELEDSLQAGTVESALRVGVVAGGAARLIDAVAGLFGGGELGEGFGGRERVTGGEGDESDGESGKCDGGERAAERAAESAQRKCGGRK